MLAYLRNRYKHIRPYVNIARPDNWFKNIFILPGILFATAFNKYTVSELLLRTVIGVVSACLAASANYIINEWLDAECDKFHPVKKNRPSPTGIVRAPLVYAEYIAVLVASLAVASSLSNAFICALILLLIMGIVYNVKPFRTKDRVYLDVLSESFNNPIRLLLGWFIVAGNTLPPSTLLLAYWIGGAFIMAGKRLAELRFINDAHIAASYRRSFRFYTEERLLMSSVCYAMTSGLFLGVFLVKYRIELVLSFPLFAILFTWYLRLCLKPDSVAQHPENLYKERAFFAFVIFFTVIFILLVYLDIPALSRLIDPSILSL